MSPIIQDPTTGRKLQRGLRLTSLPDSVLAPEIVGVVLLEDWTAPLSDISRGCTGSARVGGVAAEIGHVTLVRVGLGNPYEFVVTRLWFSTETAQRIIVRQPSALAGQTPNTSTSFTDFGTPGRPTSQLGTLTQVGMSAGRNLIIADILADTLYQFDVNIRIGTFGDNIVLTGLFIAGETVNTSLSAGFDWTESPPQG